MNRLILNRSQAFQFIGRILFGRPKRSCLSIVLMLAVCSLTVAQEGNAVHAQQSETAYWSSFRNGGQSQISKDALLPTNWSYKEGILWEAELPGYGQSAPLIVGDKVLLTAVAGPEKESNLVVCLDRETGEELWRTSHATSLAGPSNYMYSRAAPTPVADDEQMIAFFESGDLIAVRISDGEKLWGRDLKQEIGELKSRHGLGSSLAQTDDLFFINLEHDGPSALLAIRKSDGTTLWKTERPSGSSWSSPVVMKREGRSQVVVSSAGEVAGYHSRTGEELWKIEGMVGNSVPSPLVIGNRIFLGSRKPEFGSVDAAAQSNLCLEFKDGESSPTIAWRSHRCIADYCSPVVCGDFLFLINGNGILGCLDKNTGEEKYRQRLGFECWATPVVQGNQLFVFGKNGQSRVIEAEENFKSIAENSLWDSANPPSPVSYVEYFPARQDAGHGPVAKHRGTKDGGHPGKHSGGESTTDSHGSGKNPGAAMLAGMLKADKDGDETLSGDEIPKRLVAVMENIDLNHDGSLDKGELEKMANSFAAKRAGSKASSRDPIVYGVAADPRGILIRTGTRLYAIGRKAGQ